MSTEATKDTQPAIEAAPPADAPSWHGPVKELREADAKHDTRLTSLESGFARLESKTDAQTVLLGEIKGLLYSPKARWVVLTIAGAAYVYAKAHNIKIPFLED